MGDGSTEIATVESDTKRVISCDQVIFTSVRSLVGEGYRIITASRGVCSEEKVDITRRSPSHGGLYESPGDSVGLLSYVLSSGRHCIAYSCHAGREHTSRGGQRVYTHMILLDRDEYRQFNSNPVYLHSRLADVVDREGPILEPQRQIERLQLPVAKPIQEPLSAQRGWIWAVGSSLLAGERLILVGSAEPLLLLEWALLSIPRNIREGVDVSAGIKFSSNRSMQLLMVPSEKDVPTRISAAGNIKSCHIDSSPQESVSSSGAWFNLLQRWLEQNRLADILDLTSHVCAEAPASTLDRVASICDDIDLIKNAKKETVESMANRYSHLSVETPAEEVLIKQLINTAQQRLSDQAPS
ncbi:MAG: GAP1-N2 domain-containing protein [Planctomycetota bacterium]